MPRQYSGPPQNYRNFEEFKETAIKTLNGIWGREKPFDIFDFAIENDEDGNPKLYKAVSYYEDDDMPVEQKQGEVLSSEAKQAFEQKTSAEDEEGPEEGDALPELHVKLDSFIEQVIGKVPAKKSLFQKIMNKAPAKDKADGKKRLNGNA